METFGTWILQQLDNRGWTQAELARRAHIGEATLSRIISGMRGIGPDACLSIARALNEQPEHVFRLAGLLPPLPEPVAEEREALTLLRRLPNQARQLILTQLRALAGARSAPTYNATAEDSPTYGQPPVAAPTDLEQELLDEFRQLPDQWQREALDEIEKLQRYANQVRIIGDEREQTP